ncbi:MAG: hypothetical protein M3R68_00990 [Acidobacteriota bacterium]|nr:hypothetical protein [Acidobacteriota bacterium]
METLIPFLKHSSALDLLVIIVVILSTVIMIPVGIWMVVAARSRKPICFFLIAALLPLLLGLLGTYLRLRNVEMARALFPEVGSEVVTAARQEAWLTTYIGASGTAFIGLIGLTGLVLKKDRKA